MAESYFPESEFLNHVIAGEIAFDDTPFGQANLTRLLGFADDPDRSNRDWAAFVISGLPLDGDAIRTALLRLATDEDPDTRDEAIVGLARRDPVAALALLRPLLTAELGTVTLEAATILGDPSLVPLLRELRLWEGGETVRARLEDAISACENGIGVDDWPDTGEQ